MEHPGLAAARLAPSAHNTQPWRFTYEFGASAQAGGSVLVGWDAERALPAGDPDGRYLMTSLGAATESLLLGAGADGLVGEVEALLSPSSWTGARAHLQPGVAPADEPLRAAIPKRQTTRLPFEGIFDRARHARDLRELEKEARVGGCELTVVDDPGRLARVADLTGEGTARNFADTAVFGEFSDWLRLDPRDPRWSRDGLNLDALRLGRTQRLAAPAALRPAVMRLLSLAGGHRLAAAGQAGLARRTPTFCLLTARGPSLEDSFAGGRVLQRVWLRATSLDLKVHPMTAAMDHTETRAELAATFGVPTDAPMIACFRLGHTKDFFCVRRGPRPVPRARLPVSELLAPADAASCPAPSLESCPPST